MDIMLQWVITSLVVLMALVFLVRHMLAIGRPQKGCGSSCGSCSRQELLDKRLASIEDN